MRCIEMRIFRISRTDRVVDSVVDFRPPEISRARFLIRIIQGFPANVVVCVQIQSVTFTSQSRLQTTRDFVSSFSRSYDLIITFRRSHCRVIVEKPFSGDLPDKPFLRLRLRFRRARNLPVRAPEKRCSKNVLSYVNKICYM